MSETSPLVTAEELQRSPDDDYRYELVSGRVIRMSPVGFDHGRVVMQVGALLHQYLQRHPLGVVVTEVGFKLASNPDTVRGPDIAFIHNDRVPPRGTRGFVNGPPDLVIEVLSPDDRSGIREKTNEYLTRGVLMVVVIDPDEKTVTAHSLDAPARAIQSEDDVLDLGGVIPGFSFRLQEIFE